MSLTIGSAIASGLSGLNAASSRVESAANNVVKLRTPAARTADTTESIDIAAPPPPPPTTSPETEFAEFVSAEQAFKAGTTVIATNDHMLGTLLDVKV
ncbi:MAG: hypothetical protein VCD50_12765 [Alphaproteobacteria bacterium]